MIIISREQWGARPPKNDPVYVAPSKRQYFVVHHSGGPVDQTVRAIQDWCMDGRGFNDIDYNFLVRGDSGEVYQGRGWDIVGAHTVGYNTSGAGVCVIGTDQASDAAKRAVRWLFEQYNARCGKILIMHGHRDLDPPRTCPGDHIEAWLMAGMPILEADMNNADVDVILNRDAVQNPYSDRETNPMITVRTALKAAAQADLTSRATQAEVSALRNDVAGLRALIEERLPAS